MVRPALSPQREPALPAAARVRSRAYGWYIGGVGSWFGAFGMQGVVFSWLVVGVLEQPAERVGLAQSALMIPGFLLILFGGAIADRHDRRALLMGLHGLASLLALGLLALVASETLSLGLLCGYALLMGTVGAFAMPARDSLLSEVVPSGDMMRAVTGLTITQWATQAVGALLAGGARFAGIGPAIGLQAALLLAGVALLRPLPPAPAHADARLEKLRLADLASGVREVARSRELLPMLGLVACVGMLFVGPFMVVFPLLLRDFYGGDVGDLGVLSAAFPAGVITGSLALLWRGRLRRKGLAALRALLFGSLCLGAVSLGLPFVGTLAAVYVWGLGAAVFMNASRTLFQERAPDGQRARVLSVYTLGFMGASGVVGAPLSGVLVGWVGPLGTCAVTASAMIVAVLAAWLLTDVAHVE